MPFYERKDCLSKQILSKIILVSFFSTLFTFSLPSAFAATLSLAWDPSSGPNVAGYKLYYGTSSRNYPYKVDTGKSTNCSLSGLTAGKKYYFAATAYDSSKVESDYSSEISYTVPTASTTSSGSSGTTSSSPSTGASGNSTPYGSFSTTTTSTFNKSITSPYYYSSVSSSNNSMRMEFGEIDVNDQWKTVTLKRLYDEPVVIVGALSYNDSNPSVIRVRNVTRSSFQVRVQEWEYLDGYHGSEKVNYLVIESGSYELPGGSRVEAGRFGANAVGSFAAVQFKQPFNTVPVVMTTTTSVNEGDAVAMRLRNITTRTFDYRIQEQEANDQRHTPEEAGYIAWEPSAGSMGGLVFEIGRTANSVTHNFQALPFYEPFLSPPVFLAGMQTFDGSDTAAVRWQKKKPAGVEIKVEEEQSEDAETNHIAEVIGYMVFKSQ